MLSPPGSRRILLSSSFLEGMRGVDVIACSEAGETEQSKQSNELLAGGCVSNSSSRGGGLAPGALWARGGEALVTGSRCPACGTQTLRNSYYSWQQIRGSICYFLVRWRVFGIYPCARCFGVAAYLILVFLGSLVGNLNPPNGIFHSPLPNCSDTLMR